MSDFKNRLTTESLELSQRVSKLENFLRSENSAKLKDVDRRDLVNQLSHMKNYLRVLQRRFDKLCFYTMFSMKYYHELENIL